MDQEQPAFPEWLKRSFSPDGTRRSVQALINELGLSTVCESALCPNLLDCWSLRQLTFMVLGDRCTRRCGFCAVSTGRPAPADATEPSRVAEAVKRLSLRHVVITSVARDDLRDEGAGHVAAVIEAVREANPGVTVEALVPDFHARRELLDQLLGWGRPEVFAHNIETIERLSPRVRPQASYHRSLAVLAMAASHPTQPIIKAGIMLGLGETEPELVRTLIELRAAGATHLTIGQYLRPTLKHLPVAEYVNPAQFQRYERLAYEHGMSWVRSGPFVRSSYRAIDALEPARVGTQETQ